MAARFFLKLPAALAALLAAATALAGPLVTRFDALPAEAESALESVRRLLRASPSLAKR